MARRYRLKPGFESFDITDGPDAGRRYVRTLTYTEPPAGFESRFEPVPAPGAECDRVLPDCAQAPSTGDFGGAGTGDRSGKKTQKHKSANTGGNQ